MTIREYNQFCRSMGLTRYYEPGEAINLNDSNYVSDYCVKSTVSPGSHHTGYFNNSYRTSVVGYSTYEECLIIFRENQIAKPCRDLDKARKYIEDRVRELHAKIAENKKKERRARIAEL